MISQSEAWQIAKLFAEDVEHHVGGNLRAVFVIGSLSIGAYQAGRSDIDTFIVVKEEPSNGTKEVIKELASTYRDRFQIPKDFGVVTATESELYPPYNPERELAPEIMRLKRGTLIHGAYDVSRIPEPTRDDFVQYAGLFYPWLRENYIDLRPEDARTIDATVNTLLYEMRLLIWHQTSEYVLDKRKIVSLFHDFVRDSQFDSELDSIQRYLCNEGDTPMELSVIEATLKHVSQIVRNRVPLG